MKIIVLCALNEELKILNSNLEILKTEGEYPFKFYYGKYKNLEVITAKCGLGKIRSASFTQFCIDNFKFDLIVNFGSCGCINDELKIGDLIYCVKTIEYDFLTLRNFFPEFECNFKISDELLEKYNIKKGILLTATQNVDSVEKKRVLREKFSGDIADWEGASISQVCTINKKQFLIFKTVTDRGDENILNDYKKNFKFFLNKNSSILLSLLSEI